MMAEEPSIMTTLGTPIPIAQLTPLLTDPSSRSIKAAVTLIWPYSSATKVVAFLLAEPDFRLRRTRGQVRAQFSGSSAAAIERSGIESGDEVTLCLDGVEFVHCETVATPGTGVEFELRFTERLLLESRQQESHKLSIINVNHPEMEAEESRNATATDPIPETEPLKPRETYTPARPEIKLAEDEFSSPAFIKRARTSYGSLWEDGLDLEDGTVKGKGRKRTRLSSAWTFASRSPTPELEEEGPVELDAATNLNSSKRTTIQAPTMSDEGVQTEALEVGASEALLEFARQSIDTSQNGFNAERSFLGDGNISAQGPPASFMDFSDRQHTIDIAQPSSPRLHPTSSGTLPLDSPLHAQNLGKFVEPVENEPSEHSLGGFIPISKVPQLNEQSQAGAYASSHAVHPNDPVPVDFQVFENSRFGLNDLHMAGIEQPVHPEYQYGQWQSEIAQLSHEASENHFEKREDNDRLGVGEHDVHQADQNQQLPVSPGIDGHVQQYPDLDEGLSGNSQPSAWQHRLTSQSYPELPDFGDNLDALVRSLSGPQSRSMSRSASPQSALVDLTERDGEGEVGDDEDEDEGGDHGSAHLRLTSRLSTTPADQHEDPEETYERENSEEEENYHGETNSPRDRVRQIPQARRWELEQHEDIEMEDELQAGDEYYDEDGLDSQGNPYPPGFYERKEGQLEVDENEESYDEDDMENEAPTKLGQQNDPVVIDLLSSDDEEDNPPKVAPTAPEIQPETSNSYSSEASDDESDGDIDNDAEEFQHRAAAPQIATETDAEITEDESLESAEDQSDEEDLVDVSGQILPSSKLFGSKNGEAQASLEDGEQDSTLAEISGKALVESLTSDGSNEDEDEKKSVKIRNDATMVRRAGEVDPQTPNALPSKQDLELRKQSTPPIITNHGADYDQKLARGDARDSSHSVIQHTSNENTGKLPPQRPSLFSRVFSIDGANDEPEDQVSYPALPHVEPSVNTPVAKSQNLSQSFGVRFPISSAQLPTPEDTQVAQDALSQNTFSTSPTAESKIEIDIPATTFKRATGALTSEPTATSEVDNPTMGDHGLQEMEVESITGGAAPTGSVVEVLVEGAKEGRTSQVNAEGVAEEVSPRVEPRHMEPFSEALVAEEPIFTPETPRRSHRRVKSASKVIDNTENIRLAPVTPINKSNKDSSSSGTQNVRESPVVIIDKPSVHKGHDASIELALSSLESPERHHDLRRPAIVDLKLRLNRNLRTELEDFKPLKILRYELNKKLDVLAIVTTAPPEPERVKNGPRHYLITFNITDPSIAPSGVTEVQIFRPYKEALPTVKVGDGILLRNFHVISLKNRGFGLRSDPESSSWAVFKGLDEVEVRGPPVEYGTGEKDHVAQMKEWYEKLDAAATAKLRRANGDKGAVAGVGAVAAGVGGGV